MTAQRFLRGSVEDMVEEIEDRHDDAERSVCHRQIRLTAIKNRIFLIRIFEVYGREKIG